MPKISADAIIEELLVDPLYSVRENGTVFRFDDIYQTWIEVKGSSSRSNERKRYLKITYRQKKIYLHRLFYRAFVGLLLPGRVIDHIDSNPQNNQIENLRQITNSENVKGSHRGPTGPRLKPPQVLQIREAYDAGIAVSEIAKIWNKATWTIYQIGRREIWKTL